MPKIYIYEEDGGKYVYNDTGNDPSNMLSDIPIGHDFTLREPPNTYETWYWIDSKWTADQPS